MRTRTCIYVYIIMLLFLLVTILITLSDIRCFQCVHLKRTATTVKCLVRRGIVLDPQLVTELMENVTKVV